MCPVVIQSLQHTGCSNRITNDGFLLSDELIIFAFFTIRLMSLGLNDGFRVSVFGFVDCLVCSSFNSLLPKCCFLNIQV